ncbi:MAG: M28 family peptidase [Saprospiraceae bacterium]|nr:M28 family peptidase [Saprospiraceae bacterium]
MSISTTGFCQNQDEDALIIKDIHNYTLTEAQCYDWLTHLTTECKGRLAGSANAEKAVQYTKQMMDTMGFTKTWLQPCSVKKWNRGKPEQVHIKYDGKKVQLNALALGNSIGTPEEGILAEVVEVKSLDEVEKLGREGIEGKIVFYNRQMDPTQLRTFNAYGGAVDQRVWGASKAAEYGGLASIVRSMTLRQDDYPHTGTLVYKEDIPQVPGLAISTNDANMLSALLQKQKVMMSVWTNCAPGEEAISYNVIGEITGSEYPDEIIVVGGHLDAWDVGGGAHDDGAGCVHSLQVIHSLKGIGYTPKHTIRCVMFMNEENGLAGGREYARVSNENGEFHLAALESDAGGFVPRGFSFDADAEVLKPFYAKVSKWLPLLESYGLYFTTGGSGADISPLKSQKGLLIGLRPDSQRYFDYHHTTIDQIDVVNKRELELGAAAMASLIYLIDKYGLK